MLSRTPFDRRQAVWLFAVAGLVFAMVLLGGATRLTESGLSMVNWKPVTGFLPPMSEEAWQAEFEKYRAFPEYQKINKGMSLAEFKEIFWFEFSHRVLGRLIGLAFFLPFVWFLVRRQVPKGRAVIYFALLVLGGMQGVVGWWMVKSGLVDRPDVSQYRLATHLGLAVLILAALVWTGLCLWQPREPGGEAEDVSVLTKFTLAVLGLIFLQILSGAMVAGLDGGFVYNSFPMMNEYWLAPEVFTLSPWWLNAFENEVGAQFFHRLGAYTTVIVIIAFWFFGRKAVSSDRTRRAFNLLLLAVLLQFALGIATLLLVVPVSLGVLHQGGALLTFMAAVYLLFCLRLTGNRG